MACYCMSTWGDRGGLLLYVNMGVYGGGLLLYVNMGKICVACYCVLTWGRYGWPVTVC